MIALDYGMHGYLTGFGTDGSVQPEIAESWEASADAMVWRFKLRRGLTFHSGKDVTVEDVVASVNHHRGEGNTSAGAPLIASVVEIGTDGTDTVVFTLESGNADFPAVFTNYQFAMMPSTDGKADWQAGVGCGPYRLVEFDAGVAARLSRFENDWNDQRGWIDEIEMASMVDPTARTTAFVSGDVDAIDKVDLKTAALLQRNPGVTVNSVSGNQHYTFAMRTNADPFTDQNVRLAMKYAINRQELVDKILFGHGTIGNDHPIGRGQRFFNDALEQTAYDPDRAKFHLKEAGLDGVSVELAAADAAFPGAVDAAVLYQAFAKEAAIDITVNRVPNDGYWSDIWLKHPFCAVYWGGRPVEDAMLTTAYAAGAAWNDTFWENERFNTLLVAARAELDEAKRRDMYFEMQAILNRDGGAVIPMFANYVFGTSDKVQTGDFATNWDMDGERWMERWWLA